MSTDRQKPNNVKGAAPRPKQPQVMGPKPGFSQIQEPLDTLLRRVELAPDSVTPADATYLQRTVGNLAVGRLTDIVRRRPSVVKSNAGFSPLRHTLNNRSRSVSLAADSKTSRRDTFFRPQGLDSDAAQMGGKKKIVAENRANPAGLADAGTKHEHQVITHGSLRSDQIQRKPKDIDQKFKLEYDDKGEVTNVGASRAAVSRATKVNYLIREEWVKPETPLIGGHLFKREYGGPDDETNVVPWTNDAESKYTTFEDDYASKAKSAAPVEAEVHTEATFVDRPDLETSDGELLASSWPSSDAPGRQKRISEFETVAETFADIPQKVAVTVTIPPSQTLTFSAPGTTTIEPPFVKNKSALKSGFTPTKRPFDLDPKRKRLFIEVANWRDQKEASRKKLQHEWKHREDFGLASGDKQNPGNLKIYEKKIKDHIEDVSKKQILGTYRGTTTVLHYLDETTNVWACTKEDGSLVGAWKLSPQQVVGLLSFGKVA